MLVVGEGERSWGMLTESRDIWRILERIFVEVACDVGNVRVDFSEAVIEYTELPKLVLGSRDRQGQPTRYLYVWLKKSSLPISRYLSRCQQK